MTDGSQNHDDEFAFHLGWRDRLVAYFKRFCGEREDSSEDLASNFLVERARICVERGYAEAQILAAARRFWLDSKRRQKREEHALQRLLRPLDEAPITEGEERVEFPHDKGLALLAGFGGTSTDYGALLLLEERSIWAAGLLFAPPALRAEWTPGAFAEALWPWSLSHRRRRVRAESATIGELWARARADWARDQWPRWHRRRWAEALGVSCSAYDRAVARGRAQVVDAKGARTVRHLFPLWRRAGEER